MVTTDLSKHYRMQRKNTIVFAIEILFKVTNANFSPED